MSLSKEQIVSCNDVKTKKVEVPEWGGHCYVRLMTAGARDEWETLAIRSRINDDPSKATLKGLRSMLVALTLCDETGDLVFSKNDLSSIEKKSSSALDRVIEAAQILNGLTGESVEEQKKS